jgi:hypothetical protein
VRTDSSESAAFSAAYNALISSRFNAFRAAGRFIDSTRTAPWSARATSASSITTAR